MRYLLPFALLLAGACSSPTAEQSSATAPAAQPPATTTPAGLPAPDTTRPAQVTAQSDTLKVVRRAHPFSSPSAPDQFALVLRGPRLLDGEATFTITDASGQVIFREQLKAADLEASLVYEMKNLTATTAEREAFVRRRMDEFFADKNFRQPALPASATYRPGATDRTTWDDLRKRPDSIAFSYLVGKEDRHQLAWSPLRKQVVKL